jgi:hypothetical protein
MGEQVRNDDDEADGDGPRDPPVNEPAGHLVEPFYAGLHGAHDSGATSPEEEAPPDPDPWTRASRAHASLGAPASDGEPASPASDGEPVPGEDRATFGMFVKALVVTALLVAFSAAVYFVFGV